MRTSDTRKLSSKTSGRRPTKPKSAAAIDRGFAPQVLARATELAGAYAFITRTSPEGEFLAEVLEFPGVLGVGASRELAFKEAHELLITALATMLELDEPLPAPASDNKRTQQVNIRLTDLERLRLETLARRQGFRSLSDYIRAAALRPAS